MLEINDLFRSESTFEKNKKIIINGGLTEKMFDQIHVNTPFKEHPRRIPTIYGYQVNYQYEFDFDEVLGFVTVPEKDLFDEKRTYYVDYVIYCKDFYIFKFKTTEIRTIANIKLTDNFMEANIACNDFYSVLREDYELTNEDYPKDDYPDDEWDDEEYSYHPSKTKRVDEILTEKAINKLLEIQNYYRTFLERLRFHKIYIR